MTGWFQREVQRKLFIWNRSNGLKTPAGEVFPDELQSLLIVPVNKENQCFGWLIAYNKLRDDSTLVQEQKLLGTDEFGSVEASLMQSAAVLLASHALNGQLFHEQEKLIVDIIHTLVSVIEAKDIYTCGHSNRVAMFARCLAEQMGLPEQDCENIYLSGLLHDVGKVGVADDILLKPDKLSPEEYECIKTHPERGYRILQGLKPLANLLPGVLHHHEAINGKGYPHGLKDQEIPLMARVIAVADAYDALTSDRAYRKGMSLEKTEEILLKERGQQWDATVIDAYFAVREKIREIALHWSNALFIQLVANPQEVENSVTHSNDHRVRKAVAARRKQS